MKSYHPNTHFLALGRLHVMDAAALSTEALMHFSQGNHTLAMYCVDAIQIHHEAVSTSALDSSRALTELAYEMGRQDFNSSVIEPVLCRAAAIAADTLTGNLEVLIVASHIRLLKGNPFGARQLLDRLKKLLPEGIDLETIDETLARRFDECSRAICDAVDAIYKSQGVPQAR